MILAYPGAKLKRLVLNKTSFLDEQCHWICVKLSVIKDSDEETPRGHQ